MRVGSDRAKKATTQLLKQEYATLKFKDGESVDDFSLRLQSLISKLRSHGVTIDVERISSVILRGVSYEGRLIGRDACNREQEGNRDTRIRQVRAISMM